jgi:glucose-6-phosphate isomerase
MSKLTRSAAWKALEAHYQKNHDAQMRDLFAQDPKRFEKFSLQFNDILLDYSKNRITDETRKLLLDLANGVDLKTWIGRMFAGEKINFTEGRAVLHIALRNRSNRPILMDGKDVMPEVNAVLAKMKAFAAKVERSEIEAGASLLAVELSEHIGFVIESLKPHAEELGITGRNLLA